MARGWESKAVESQQEEAARSSPSSGRQPLSSADQQRWSRRQTLELARARALADLGRASAAAHRRMLELTIEALDAELAALGCD